MLEEYVNKRLITVEERLHPWNWDSWNLGTITIGIEFFPVPYNTNDWTAFIPTGSKDKPDGLSTVNHAFVLFFDKKRKGPQFYYDSGLIREYMSNNRDRLSKHQESNDDYSCIGYKINLKDMFISCGKSPSVVASN